MFYVCPLSCIKLYSFEFALCKFSGLQHQRIIKLLIHEPLTIFLNHPVHFFRHLPLKLKFMQGKKQKTYTCRLLVTELIGIYTLTPYSIRNDWSHVKADDQDLSHTALSQTHEKGRTLYLELTF